MTILLYRFQDFIRESPSFLAGSYEPATNTKACMNPNSDGDGGEGPSSCEVNQEPRDIHAARQQHERIHSQTLTAEPTSPLRKSPLKDRLKNRNDSPPTPSFPSRHKKHHSSSAKRPGPTVQHNGDTPPVHIVEPEIVSDDAELKQRHAGKASAQRLREVDFYRNPTVLGRCIVNQKYGNALKRALQKPEEANIWMCSKRNTQSTYSIRQLPIHIACANLMFTYDERQTRLLNELIVTLVLSYPEGAHMSDHRDRLPVLDAIWHGVDPQTLAIFFVAKPEALRVRDKKGRSLSDLNRYRNGLNKVEVQKVLDKGVSYWQTAREEVLLRLKIGQISVPENGDASVASNEVLASSQPGDDSVVDEDKNVVAKTGTDEVVALSWDQLEKRSIAAEMILAEVNERNYDLSRRVEATTTMEEVLAKELLSELRRLENVNTELTRKVRSIESMLEKFLLKQNNETEGQLRLALAEVSSLAAISDKSSLADQSRRPGAFRKVREKIQHLSRQQEEERERIRKIKVVIDSLTEAGYESGTTVHSELSSKSNYSNEFKNAPGLIVDRTPSTRLKANNLELSAIFRYGAAYDFARRFPDVEDASADDLDVIFAWAASQESVSSFKDVDISSTYSPIKPVPTQIVHDKTRTQGHFEIKLPALLPYDETALNIDSSYFEESGTHSMEEIDPILLNDEHTGVLSDTQVSI